MSANRSWMYARLKDGLLNPNFLQGINEFIDFAKMHPECMDGIKIKCPCNHRKCQNRAFHMEDTVRYHLMKYGFVPYYYLWVLHGEPSISDSSTHGQDVGNESVLGVEPLSQNLCQQMVMDVAGPDFSRTNTEEPPNAVAQKLFEMLIAANQEAWLGCENHSQLSAVARMLNIKAEHHLTERCFDDFCQFLKELLPTDNVMPDNFYNTKKLVQGLGLPVEKIHCCPNGCMIYWGEDSELMSCKLCDFPRYKQRRVGSSKNKKNIPYKKMYYFPLTPRLQRLYASNVIAKEMRWHAEHEPEEGVMRHCSDSPAWKHFNSTHLSFALEKSKM
ncbi:uncharacterized protein LOC120278460 [Dioscorea cayenensis subsp. rotundata]|uniref:Uncharacterized protein LOC120278460 n=1 Tax=Dioscorea cayennensis subsp. rotundata TaxID=55577 RepID=A0AB40CMG9_DIOCR|nr:uncharacterized protein LOC120278460 [Dioscorea cayenensis subsp. rotundata]